MKIFAVRLNPDEDLKQSLKVFVHAHNIQAGFILTAIGSLKQAQLRFANQPQSIVLAGKFEILSLAGTLSIHGLHLHMAIADTTGKTIGGHLDQGNLIYTTAEIVLGEIEDLTFRRDRDDQTGFQELSILPRL
jgi:predicted DNA-binding protein with PD1-like motif